MGETKEDERVKSERMNEELFTDPFQTRGSLTQDTPLLRGVLNKTGKREEEEREREGDDVMCCVRPKVFFCFFGFLGVVWKGVG